MSYSPILIGTDCIFCTGLMIGKPLQFGYNLWSFCVCCKFCRILSFVRGFAAGAGQDLTIFYGVPSRSKFIYGLMFKFRLERILIFRHRNMGGLRPLGL